MLDNTSGYEVPLEGGGTTLPMKRLFMRKLKEVLRLRHELGLGQRQIARSCSIGHGTVYEYLRRAQEAGVSWPLPEGWDEARLEEALFGHPLRRYETRRPAPDSAHLHQELQSHRHLALQLLWEEYRQAHPDGYGYSHFCELYQRWRRRLDVVLRQEHKAGEKLFVDYAGATIPVHDPQGGPVRQVSLFVAVLGASNYTYAEATESQELEHWIASHIRAFYEHLLARGKTKMQALVAVMRKLLHAIFGMFKHNQTFDGHKVYALVPAATPTLVAQEAA